MKPYHHAWLMKHPGRSSEWLADRLRDGFHIHHLDGNRANNTPDNLVLIEGADHMRLHNPLFEPPLVPLWAARRRKQAEPKPEPEQGTDAERRRARLAKGREARMKRGARG